MAKIKFSDRSNNETMANIDFRDGKILVLAKVEIIWHWFRVIDHIACESGCKEREEYQRTECPDCDLGKQHTLHCPPMSIFPLKAKGN